MQMIRMLADWCAAEDRETAHWLTAGNTFTVDDDTAERAVDDDGAAEYVGTKPSKKAVPATVDGEPVVSAHAASIAVDTPEPTPENVPGGLGGDAAAIPATGAPAGEPAPNTAPTKAQTKAAATKAGEDAPA